MVYIVTCQRIARQRLGKHPAICARNSRTNVSSRLLGNIQRDNGLARWLSHDLFSVWSVLRDDRTVFSVRVPFREDMRKYRNGNITKLCRQQAEVIQNHDNENVRNIRQGEARHRKYKRLKLGGGQAYVRSSD
jgi:hypothetical protein